MNVRVAIDGSKEEADVLASPSAFFVDQANAKAIVEQKSYCHVKGRSVKAIVPACSPTVASQTPAADFERLRACYLACLLAAAGAGAKSIVVMPLGVGVRMTRTSTRGRTLPDGLWGNLFWSHAKSALAAKAAVEEACQSVPGDIDVVFVVPSEALDDWDGAMQFGR